MTQRLDPHAIEARLRDLPDWSLGRDGMLHAEFGLGTFAHAMQFANVIAYLAECADHHPDLCLHGYSRVSVRLMTHAAGGVTERDFALAAQISALPRPS